jgi:hypothetical protein
VRVTLATVICHNAIVYMSTVTEKEVITDNLLLLYLINKVHEKSNHYVGMTTLQNLVFIAEKILNEKGIKTFNYNFFA